MFSSLGSIGRIGGFKSDALEMWILSNRDILEYNKKAEDSRQVFLSRGSNSPYSQAQDVNFPLNKQISWQPPLLIEQGLVPVNVRRKVRKILILVGQMNEKKIKNRFFACKTNN